ncbi:hypothetical protein VKT23_010922 [Stygiomarasmius scandens]|uniref:WD40 repeat-like protein n=1 Tax=Marasmiellus scandens TaxID=2682957 RepID=A0ABR1JBE4_9AGAR
MSSSTVPPSHRPAPITTLPIVTIQSTFPTVVNEIYNGVIPFEDIWVSCYDHSPSGPRSSHSKVTVVLDDVDREKVNLETKQGEGSDLKMAEATSGLTNSYTISLPSFSISSVRLLTPVQEYADPERSNTRRPHRITSFAVAEDKSQLTTGFLDGSVYLYAVHPLPSPSTSSSIKKYATSASYEPPRATYTTHRQTLVSSSSKAHKSTVTSLRFFPSSRVILSSSADFSVQIYPADPLSPFVTPNLPMDKQSPRVPAVRALVGHTRAVTSTAILGRGRSIMSTGTDAMIRTWDVSKGEQVPESVVRSIVGVNKMVFREASIEGSGINGADTLPSVTAVQGRLYCALQDGSFEVFQLSNEPRPKSLFRSTRSPHGAVTAIAISSAISGDEGGYLAVGTAGGVISIYRLPSPSLSAESDALSTLLSEAILKFRRSDAGIEDISFISLPDEVIGLVIATTDGLPWIARLHGLSRSSPELGLDAGHVRASLYAELTGGDVDPVRAIVVLGPGEGDEKNVEIWTAGDDGIVRRYLVV